MKGVPQGRYTSMDGRGRCMDNVFGIPPGSSEAGNGREAIIAGGSPPVVPGAIDVRVLGCRPSAIMGHIGG